MGEHEQAPMMKIGELGERTSLSHRTLRHYEEIGLITPTGRTEGGFRLYTESDFERLMLIRRMKPLGYSLEEMRDLLHVVDRLDGHDHVDRDAARNELQACMAEASERREKLARQVVMADEFIELLGRV